MDCVNDSVSLEITAAAKILSAEMQRAAKEVESAEKRSQIIAQYSAALAKLHDSVKPRATPLRALLNQDTYSDERYEEEAEREEAMHQVDEEYASTLWPEERPAPKVGDTITIYGVDDCPELIVLDVRANGDLFCLTKNTVGESAFGESSNYADKDCKLRQTCEKWLAGLAERGLDLTHIKEREIDLIGTGNIDYGIIKAQAAPLSLEEYLHYRRAIPKINHHWWLRSPYTRGTNYAWHVITGGNASYDDVSYSCGVRPALILDSLLSVSKKGG